MSNEILYLLCIIALITAGLWVWALIKTK